MFQYIDIQLFFQKNIGKTLQKKLVNIHKEFYEEDKKQNSIAQEILKEFQSKKDFLFKTQICADDGSDSNPSEDNINTKEIFINVTENEIEGGLKIEGECKTTEASQILIKKENTAKVSKKELKSNLPSTKESKPYIQKERKISKKFGYQKPVAQYIEIVDSWTQTSFHEETTTTEEPKTVSKASQLENSYITKRGRQLTNDNFNLKMRSTFINGRSHENSSTKAEILNTKTRGHELASLGRKGLQINPPDFKNQTSIIKYMNNIPGQLQEPLELISKKGVSRVGGSIVTKVERDVPFPLSQFPVRKVGNHKKGNHSALVKTICLIIHYRTELGQPKLFQIDFRKI